MPRRRGRAATPRRPRRTRVPAAAGAPWACRRDRSGRRRTRRAGAGQVHHLPAGQLPRTRSTPLPDADQHVVEGRSSSPRSCARRRGRPARRRRRGSAGTSRGRGPASSTRWPAAATPRAPAATRLAVARRAGCAGRPDTVARAAGPSRRPAPRPPAARRCSRRAPRRARGGRAARARAASSGIGSTNSRVAAERRGAHRQRRRPRRRRRGPTAHHRASRASASARGSPAAAQLARGPLGDASRRRVPSTGSAAQQRAGRRRGRARRWSVDSRSMRRTLAAAVRAPELVFAGREPLP